MSISILVRMWVNVYERWQSPLAEGEGNLHLLFSYQSPGLGSLPTSPALSER